jgi:hypothetical protein
MPTQLSPGVNVTEIDLTTIVPAVATSEGAIGGVFRWGPIAERVLVDNEQKLVTRFGKPTSLNAETFFTAASFLAYGNRLYVSRAANTTGDGAANSTNATLSAIAIVDDDAENLDSTLLFVRNVLNEKDYIAKTANGDFDADTDLKWIAKYPGAMGNSLKISVCDSSDAWYKSLVLASNTTTINSAASLMTSSIGSNTLSIKVVPVDYANATHVTAANTRGSSLHTDLTVGDLIEVGNNVVGKQMLRVVAKSTLTPAFYNATFSFDFVTNSTSLEVTSGPIADITVGSSVSGTSIPAGATVASKNASHIVISSATTGADSGTYIVKSDARFTVTVNNKIRIKTAVSEGSINRYWEYFGSFDKAPGQSEWLANLFAQDANAANGAANDALHAVVVDNKGLFSGVPGTILERFANLSRVQEAKDEQGSSIYYKDAINNGSQYVWWANDEDNAPSNNATGIASSTNTEAATYIFVGGKDGLDEDFVEEAVLYDAYDQFMNSNEADISLVLQGKARGGDRGQQLGNYIIDNICEHRKDCVAFLSPNYDAVINNIYQEVDDVVAFRNAITSSSYGVIDSGYKYMYDRYNDVYRWVPLNGDIAGLCARTDDTNDPWFSPAGYNRGIIKNVVKLAYNPSQAERDSLYKSDVNPVINIQGAGTLLYGDKTVLGKPSAFDRINVRRLFIVLEKAISLAAKYTLFEFNDAFTRTQFRNLVEPYLRDVQGRRGIFDFKVVCDETNNTPEIIDRNEFVGDIYIKPARSINFIQLNFIAVRTGVAFNEIIGLRQ